MRFLRPSTFAALAAMLATLPAAAPAFAGDAQRHARIIEQLAPKEQRAYIERLIAEQQARAAAGLGGDTTGPVLTGFNAPTTLNLSKGAAPFKIAVKATDDLSGVAYLYIYAIGPSGQQMYANAYSNYPTTSATLGAGFKNINRMAEPGEWKFNYGYGYDGAGNYAFFDGLTLEALGNTKFTVVNNLGYDIVKPTLTEGKVLTPIVSLSSFAPGTTDMAPYVGVKFTATDAGNTAVAGVKSASAAFCKLGDPNACFYVNGSYYPTGQATATFNLGGQVSAANGNVAGTYELSNLVVYDFAGNYGNMQSTLFGGTTDFSTLFPTGTSIKLKP